MPELDPKILCDPSIEEALSLWSWRISPEHSTRPPRAQAPLIALSRTLYAHRLALAFYRYEESNYHLQIHELNKRAASKELPAQKLLWSLLETLPGRTYTISGNLLDLRSDNFYSHLIDHKPSIEDTVRTWMHHYSNLKEGQQWNPTKH